MSPTRRPLLTFLCLLALLLAVPIVLTWRQVRQERLNYALIAAIDRNDAAAVRKLLYQGADPNAPVLPEDRRTLWQRLWEMLRHRPSPRSLTHNSALLEAVNWSSQWHPLPLDSNDNVETVQALVEAGADMNVRGRNNDTLLMRAAARRKWKTMQMLLSHHADVIATNAYGSTVLFYTVQSWNAEMVETLLQHGAAASLRRQRGFLVGALWNYPQAEPEQVRATVACLIRHGASVEGKDTAGVTALSLARTFHDEKLIRMLKQAGAKE